MAFAVDTTFRFADAAVGRAPRWLVPEAVARSVERLFVTVKTAKRSLNEGEAIGAASFALSPKGHHLMR